MSWTQASGHILSTENSMKLYTFSKHDINLRLVKATCASGMGEIAKGRVTLNDETDSRIQAHVTAAPALGAGTW